ncbi:MULTISPECIES: hypothetical protein [unclassified Ruminococcus]|uniref:hypothetical protein n=1 Tax=unclassified Ruminococcus TaxID=2608920 RepID=UPI002108928F|nr:MULTISPECIES: hypothetical protein [unclassified Ruminococcus]MCQ4021973.1 hypothetical protein [Ruminococcus sp. zg-924]MCQ4114509.1 hypothetical protein [Ruminococcus sp. zg-921]
MIWTIIVLIIIFAIIAIYMKNSAKHGYHFGSQMFKSSENNLDGKPEDLSDRDYYGDNNLLK